MTFPTTWDLTELLVEMLGVHSTWREKALCRGADPDLFDSSQQGEGSGRWRKYPVRVEDVVRSYCTPCPVREECREFAAGANTEGVWGGEWRHRRSGRVRVEVVPVVLPESA